MCRRTTKDQDPQMVERKFDMLHVCPSQCAPDFINNNPLANESGWVAVD
ncbi:MAG: sulfide:quinone oxidoreductase [Kiritimatiellia bacterium]|jgi:sulfide:quinone oxidoreductase